MAAKKKEPALDAKREEAKKALAGAGKGKKKKGSMPSPVRLALVILLLLGAFFMPTSLILCICMLPTGVAVIVDYRPQKTAWVTVGAVNFAGVVPAWFSLWERGHTVGSAIELLAMPETMMTAYGAALVGWLIYHQVPYIVTALMAHKADNRLKDIEKRQKELIRKWGMEVAGEQAAKGDAAAAAPNR
jgi:hypothetical protein